MSISICGHKPQDFMKFLKDVAAGLDPFDPRPHWGKIYFMYRERVAAAFPRGFFCGAVVADLLDARGDLSASPLAAGSDVPVLSAATGEPQDRRSAHRGL